MLFSATLSYSVLELTYEYMNLPEFISVTPEETVVEGINQSLFHVGKDSKLSLLLGLLKRENWSRSLIFVNTKSGVEWVAEKLKRNGYPAEGITGDLPQRQRFKLMERFKNGSIKILVATDVASRGIHVEDITHVINYDLPQDAENYIHRIGRTARAGKDGIAISLACEDFVFYLESIEAKLGHKIPVAWPEDDWFVEDTSKPVFTGRRHEKDTKERFSRGRDKQKGFPARTPARQPVREIETKPQKDHFPGSFFGFAPPGEKLKEKAEPELTFEEVAEPEQESINNIESGGEHKEKPRPKKRRRFRKKIRKKPEVIETPKEA
jgi:ATP-dependent RNA helicase RhlB